MPIIYLITKGNLTPENFQSESKKTLNIVKKASNSNVSLIQIREKNLSAELIYKLAKNALKITKSGSTKVLINDRLDIALAANADGVHLTSNSINTNVIRNIAPQEFIIGVSTHSLSKAENAKKLGADFATYSPIYETSSKINYGKPKGLNKLKEVCENLGDFPILALGGIDFNNYEKTLESGASGFAGISSLNDENVLEELFRNRATYEKQQ